MPSPSAAAASAAERQSHERPLYAERFAGGDGRIPATFEILTLTAWAPHAAQPQPVRPGSGKTRLAEALGAAERPAGEKVPR